MNKDFIESFIGRLSASEKRYISEHLSLRNRGNNFFVLFNSLASPGRKKSLVSKPGIKNRNTYYVTRSQLTEKIFKILRMYHHDSSKEQALKSICMDVEILYNKGAFADSLKLTDSSLKICEKNEWFELELYLLTWKEKLLIAILNMDNLQEEINGTLKRMRTVLCKLENLNYHKQFMYDIFLAVKKMGASRSDKEQANIHQIFSRYKNAGLTRFFSYRARISNSLAYTYYYFALQDYKKCYRYAQSHVKAVEAFQKTSETDLHEHLSVALTNVITCEVNLMEYAKLQQSLSKIRKIKYISPREVATIFAHTFIIETDMYIRIGHFHKIAGVLQSVKEGLTNYEGLLTKEQKIALYYNMTYLSIGAEKYKTALQWINKILNDYDVSIREDIYCFARILNLIIHYELGDNALLEHLVLSTYRYLYKKEKMFEVENSIMQFIRHQLTRYWSQKNLINSLTLLLHKIKNLCVNKTEHLALEYFDLISWLESKIQNRPFAEIVKEKQQGLI